MALGGLTSPRGGIGQPGHVVVDNIPMSLVPGTYTVDELPRFGQKISQGSLKYADFNPEEQAFSIEGFGDGYGLRRYSDVPSVTTRFGSTFTAEDLVARVIKESQNVSGQAGPGVLSPLIQAETLTGATTSPVWSGEVTPGTSGGIYVAGTKYLVAVGGSKAWARWQTTTTGANASGQPVINVTLATGFVAGQTVNVSQGNKTDTLVILMVVGTAVTMTSNLTHGYTAGATISTWHDTGLTLGATAVKGAIGTFNGALIIGYGAAHTAQFTTDLTNLQDVTMDGTVPVPTPTQFSTSTTGGALADSTKFTYRIAANTGGPKTLASAEVGITTGVSGANTNTVTVRWQRVPGAGGYDVYGRTAGSEQLLINITNVNTVFWVDNGSLVPGGALPTTDQTAQATPFFMFAFASNAAAAYVAGGQNTTDTNLVMSSTDGIANYKLGNNAVVCGTSDSPITGLCPGGSTLDTLALLFVAKTTEMGVIDSSGIYKPAVPFATSASSNGVGITRYLGLAGDEGRGPMIAVFPMDRTILSYAPSSSNAGTVEDLAPYGKEGFRPVNARGVVTAIQGSSHYLYYAIKNGAGNTWIISKDSVTGANTTYLYSGAHDCKTLTLTALFGTNPMMFLGYGNNIASIVLPLDGNWPVGDTACQFAASGTLQTPSIDLGFPDEPKVGVALHVVHDQVVAGHQDISIKVLYDSDTGSYSSVIGTCLTNSAAFSTTSTGTNAAGQAVVNVTSATGFAATQVITLLDPTTGVTEQQTISSISLNAITCTTNLHYSYTAGSTVSVPTISETVIPFSISALFKRVSFEADLSTDDLTTTPVLLGMSARMMLATQVYRVWSFEADVPQDDSLLNAEATANGPADRLTLWAARQANLPVVYEDRDQLQYYVRILKLREQERVPQETDMPYFSRFTFQLLEVFDLFGLPYDTLLATYDEAGVTYG